MLGGLRLGSEDVGEAIWVKGVDGRVIERPGGVDYRAQWVCLADLVEQLGQLLAIGDIASGDLGLCAQRLELCLQLFGSLCLGAGATYQEQAAGAVGLDQVTGHQGSEATGGAGDQHSAFGVEERRRAPLTDQARCPRRRDHPLAQGQLGLVFADKQGLDRRFGGLGAIGVDQQKATGVLRLGGADQAPGGGQSGVRGLLIIGDGGAGEDRETPGLPLFGQLGLHQRQGGLGWARYP